MFSFFSQSPLPSVKAVEVLNLLKEKGSILVDVREQGEYAGGHAQGAISIPLSTFSDTTGASLQAHTTVYVICQSGGRSARATGMLIGQGVKAVNVEGGTSTWSASKLPMA